ncbi:histidine kinase [Sphaerospermopsis aphanizomenoides BCCUSP55]|uniref:histidine kinase n=1 Tax=Sphaerospermopsis aphanizomenoides TaxID=459663 RepID=UPI000A814AD4|nr:histidine kinase [Sphaerospermopsis aphanizomenoides]MBK1987820.1 histidine kinase [Sphaerospermopsis aphanizomenoides BCCUSP55]
MVIDRHRRALGVFPARRDAEQALHELKNSGFPMERVSVIARNDDGQEIAGTPVREKVGDKADEGAKTGAISGGVLGGLTGLLVGLGTLALPGIGPIMLAGATATALATTLAGAGIGAVTGGLIGALIGLGIPEERARIYHERVERGEYLVIIDGTDAEIAKAREILHRWRIEEFEIYDHPENKQTTPEVIHQDVTVNKYAIGYLTMLQDAEAAINDLRNAGFPLNQIYLIHRERPQRNAFGGIHVRDSIAPAVLNLPPNRTQFYNDCIHQGNYIVIVTGNDAEIHQAAAILSRHHIKQWEVYEKNGHQDLPLQTAKRAIGVFSHRRDAEAALRELRNVGFPMSQVSLIGKDTNGGVHRDVDRGNRADEGLKTGAATGGALGGLGGLLVGLGALAIPGVGPVIAGGAAATALATTLAGGAVGAAVGGIAGGLVGLGIPEGRARVYSDRFQKGDYLVIVDGTDAEIHHAETILKRAGIEEFSIYDARNVSQPQPSFEPVRNTETVPSHHPEEAPVVIIDHREKTV